MTTRIEQRLASHVAAYRPLPVAICELCGMSLYTGAGVREHRRAHEVGMLPYGKVLHYWIDMSQWPEIVIIRWEKR